MYLPPESLCFVIRHETAFCDSVNKSFSTTDFEDITETTFEGEWL